MAVYNASNATCQPPAAHEYQPGEQAFVTIVLLFIVCGTVFGNLLVFLSLLLVKKLRTPSNLLLLSLSVSDLSIALTVEPFALYKTVNVQWGVSHSLCQIYLFLDVMLCTASILNLNAITIDRYLVITRPFQYSVRRTPRLMAVFIACVWLLAIAVSSAAFAWPPGADAEAAGDCYYTQELSYQMYATVAAFYVPLAAMLLLWARIFVIARNMAHADRAQQCRVQQNAPPSPGAQIELRVTHSQISDALLSETSLPTPCTCRVQRGSSASAFALDPPSRRDSCSDVVQAQVRSKIDNLSPAHAERNTPAPPAPHSPAHSQCALGSDELLADCDNTNGSASKCQQHCAEQHTPTHRTRTSTTQSLLSNGVPTVKRKSTSGENKALVTIATIMTCFTLCWFPFFLYAFVNPIYALIVGCDIDIGHHGRTLLLWLGYANSFMNPLIYCKFNRDFRRPFVEFLKCHCRDVNARLRLEQYAEQYGTAPANSSPSMHMGMLSVAVASPGLRSRVGVGKKARQRRLLDAHLTRRQAEEAGLLTPCTRRSKIPKEHILIAHSCVAQAQADDNHKDLLAHVSVSCASAIDNPLAVAID